MTCPNCGAENLPKTEFCSQCGASFRVQKPLGTGEKVAYGIVGAALGFGLTIVAYSAGGYFGGVGGPQFTVAKAAAAFYLVVLLCAAVLLLMVFATRRGRGLPAAPRVVAIAALVVLLGGMTLCNLISANSLFTSAS